MKRGVLLALGVVMSLLIAGPASAHYGMVIPSDQMVMQGEETNVKVDLLFWHPFEGIPMELVKPAKFGVVANGENSQSAAIVWTATRRSRGSVLKPNDCFMLVASDDWRRQHRCDSFLPAKRYPKRT